MNRKAIPVSVFSLQIHRFIQIARIARIKSKFADGACYQLCFIVTLNKENDEYISNVLIARLCSSDYVLHNMTESSIMLHGTCNFLPYHTFSLILILLI